MPATPIPERYRDILESSALGHLATIDLNGRPNVNPVWFIREGEHVYLSIKPETAKYRSIRVNPDVALSVSDPSRPDRYIELRGTVIDFELFENLSWVNQLSRKYTGGDFTNGVEGEHRYKVTVRIDHWTAQN